MPVKVAVPKETKSGELRVAMTPGLIGRLTKLGAEVLIEHKAGVGIHVNDEQYKKATIESTAKKLYSEGDVVFKVQPPTVTEAEQMKDNSILISLLYPHQNSEVVEVLRRKNITSFAMELVPRISRAQDMDVLSSQATIAGYKAVLIAADNSKFFFPMLTTAAGSVRPAKVFIIGVGVAGLQAIATARRLGAQVSAYDVRPETKEQAESLGAKFVDTGVSAVGEGGYARELTENEKNQQNEVLKKHIATCDVIITTAGVPGRPAPKILSKEMIDAMKPGAVVVDMLADMGGNCELTKPGKTIYHHDVTIVGPVDIPSSMAIHASEMYARNLINFTNLIIKDGEIELNWEDEVIMSSVVTHQGEIKNKQIEKILGEK